MLRTSASQARVPLKAFIDLLHPAPPCLATLTFGGLKA
jgi:hypothetical protein